MSSEAERNLDRARQYLAALERGADAKTVAPFLHPQLIAEELPNRLSPEGVRRDRQAMLAGVERGRQLIESQSFEITGALAAGNCVVLEVSWSGTLAATLNDQLTAGKTLRARLAVFLEFKGGQIVAQRNYDCYDPW
jgi:ketosteroid isomerase-like protein